MKGKWFDILTPPMIGIAIGLAIVTPTACITSLIEDRREASAFYGKVKECLQRPEIPTEYGQSQRSLCVSNEVDFHAGEGWHERVGDGGIKPTVREEDAQSFGCRRRKG